MIFKTLNFEEKTRLIVAMFVARINLRDDSAAEGVILAVSPSSILLTAGLIDLALLVAMLLWQPSLDTLPVLFVIVGFWGLAEAILFTQLISE